MVLNSLKDVSGDNGVHSFTVGALGLTEGSATGCLVEEYLNSNATDYFYKKRVLASRRGAQERGWSVDEEYYNAVGSSGKVIYPDKIAEVDMEQRVSEFMEETKVAALSPEYNMEDNIAKWAIVGQKLNEYCEEEYPYAGQQQPAITGRTDFTEQLTSLTDFSNASGISGFAGKVKNWNCDMPSLKNGESVFYMANKMTSFRGDMPNLTEGKKMFQYTSLKSF